VAHKRLNRRALIIRIVALAIVGSLLASLFLSLYYR